LDAIQARAVEAIFFGLILVAWCWYWHDRVFHRERTGVWRTPPKVVRGLFRRGPGNLYPTPVAGEIWGWLAVVTGLLSYVGLLEGRFEVEIGLAAHLVGIALVIASMAWVILGDRRRT
jgi:hypothetical protein